MGVVVSFINLKGGVGKSTLAMVTAEYMYFPYKKRVLIIDLDSQANLTYAMVKSDSITELSKTGSSIYKLFRSALDGHSLRLNGCWLDLR